jgi:thiol-disulfide isomerase/thioredoxin
MIIRRALSLFAFLAALVTAVSCARTSAPAGVQDFSLKSIDGQDFTLSQNKGKVTLLVFGFSRCPYCKEEIPVLNQLHDEYRDKPFQVVYVNITESEEQARDLVSAQGIRYLTLVDQKADTARLYGIVGVPANFLISKDQTSIEKVDVYRDIRAKINSLL